MSRMSDGSSQLSGLPDDVGPRVVDPGRDDSQHLFGLDLPPDRWLERVRRAITDAPECSADAAEESASAELNTLAARAGPYELIEQIGSGGMGAVWLARRADEHFDRTVAVKLIKRGMDTDEILNRFRFERHVLARLEHPHIARLYDGGSTADERPYLVMEHVDGLPIDEFCATHGLSIEERLELFRWVCLAVHHAHSSLILHRDLKPSNILVTTDGNPKLLDFGIAKVLDSSGSAATEITQTTGRILTSRYASPEQIRGERLTTAADVYSLGVILFELLTGVSPYIVDASTPRQYERAVLEQEPQWPSAAVQRRDDLSRAERRRLARTLRGDLENMIMHALDKSPQNRYGSAEQLAEDLRRYLSGLPLLAKPPGAIAKGLRLIRRRRGVLLAAAIGCVLSLAVATAAVVYMFMVPQWVEDHVRAAHLTYVERSTNVGITSLLFFNTASDWRRARRAEINPEMAEAALGEYDTALSYGTDRPEIRLERQLLLIAEALSRNSERVLELAATLPDSAPITRRFVEGWYREQGLPELRDRELDQAEWLDLRSLGLLAYLCGDPSTTIEAWSRLRLEAADPLLEATLGNIYLALDEPQLAYPRLQSAQRAFPEPERRVEMMCLFADGDVAGAFDIYKDAEFERINPVAVLQLANFLEETGDELGALKVLAGRVASGALEQTTPQKFARLMESWWSRLPPREREQLTHPAEASEPEGEVDFALLLKHYKTALELLATHPDPHPLSQRAKWTRLAVPADAEALATSQRELLTLISP
jgi:serine/threonine protein kinase